MRTAGLLFALCLSCASAPPAPIAEATPAATVAEVAPSVPPVPSATVVATAAPQAKPAPAHWTYAGEEGPLHWGDLSPDYAACKTGKEQTPIDLVSKAPQNRALAPIGYEILSPAESLGLSNNGHTVQATLKMKGALVAAGKRFDFAQFHMHTPSEHTLDGKRYDAELHLVNKTEEGALAVVGVLIRRGKENTMLASFFDHVGGVKPGKVWTLPLAGTPKPAAIDLTALVPAKARYVTYKGSLTTPPCTEDVTWFVLLDPIEISDAQLAKLKTALGGDTNRPVQARGERKVERYAP